MKSLVRSLNDRGLARFRSWIEAGATGDAPFDLLHDPATSEPVPASGEVEQNHFANRYDLAVHTAKALERCDLQRLSFEPGIWGWLSLFYFDLLCPRDLTGNRKVLAPHRYLFDPDFRTTYGHLIRAAVLAVLRHGPRAKVLLISPMGGIKDTRVLTELGSRQDLISNTSIVELASQFYFNPRRGTLRHGAASKRRSGCVQRFALVLQQLSLNYDLSGMGARQIADLLPAEFDQWKQRAKHDKETPPRAAG
jgi:hypothetical protein